MVRDTTPTSYMFDIDRTHLPEKVRGTNLRDIKSVCVCGGGGGARPPRDLHPCKYIMNMETFLNGFVPNMRGRLCEPNGRSRFSSN